jgi:hypothetical protein
VGLAASDSAGRLEGRSLDTPQRDVARSVRFAARPANQDYNIAAGGAATARPRGDDVAPFILSR